jgi:hypothetical protein
MKAAIVLVDSGRVEPRAGETCYRGDSNARHRDKQRSRVTHEEERKLMFMDSSSAHACVPTIEWEEFLGDVILNVPQTLAGRRLIDVREHLPVCRFP